MRRTNPPKMQQEHNTATADPPRGAASSLTIRLFGPFEVRVDGRLLARLRYRKSQSVLALLALRHGAPVERDWLVGLVWPERDRTQAFRNSLSELRRVLGPHGHRLRAPSHHTLRLDLSGADVDVVAFDEAIARGDRDSLEQAVALHRGPLLEGWAEEWVPEEQQVREQAYLTALETLAAQAREHGDAASAERYLRRAVAADPLRESAQRALMELLAAGGSYAAALLAYRELRKRLHQEANAEPDPETRALFERLRAEARQRAAEGVNGRGGERVNGRLRATPSPLHPFTPSPLQPARTHTLPLQLTSFIGRQTEMAALQQQLAAHRLVTLTGAGGCGKTRLALEAAADLAPAYPDGVWCVELAPLADPALVPQSVAAALRIREQPDRPLIETLVEALKPRQLLLLLDNCEHLVEACAHLAGALLRSCPRLRILATSRELLGIAGEQPYRVPSLSLPPAEGVGRRVSGVGSDRATAYTLHPTPDTVLQSEAVRLFVERATTAQPGFALTPENAEAVAQVCCRLDGIPLALELAAGRLKALPVETLSERLNDFFGVLTGGHRTALPRHQTLRALIDWSYDLLTPAEQTLLRRLSVFAGGCSLEAAEAVCADQGAGCWVLGAGCRRSESDARHSEPGAPLPAPSMHARLAGARSHYPAPEVLHLLTHLVEKSLVIYEEREGEGRYRFLEMIREYARERLVGSGEVDNRRQRHARFFLSLAERAEPELAGLDQGRWLDRLEREHNNLRAALAWSLESGESALGLRLCSALEPFWIPRGHVKEGRAQLLGLLAAPGAAPPTAVRARALGTAGSLTSLQGDMESARALLEESLVLWRRLEDRAGIATALLRLGWFTWDRWEYATACRLAEECLALRRELGEPGGIAEALTLMAKLRGEASDPTARGLLEESIAIWEALGDRISATRGLASLAHWAICENDLDTARRLYEEVLAAATELGDRPRIGWAFFGLGKVAQCHDDFALARAFFERSLRVWRELDDQHGLIDTLTYLGYTLKQQGDAAAAYERFAELLAKAREVKRPAAIVEALALMGAAAGDLGRWEEAAARCAESLRLTRPEKEVQRLSITWNLTNVARVALARGRPARAARLLGAREALRLSGRGEHEEYASAARAQMEAAEFEAAWSAGQALPLDQAIAEALQEALAGHP